MKKCLALLALLMPLAGLATPVPLQRYVQFAAVGDYGSDNKGEKKVSEVLKSKHPAFVITLGDNNYYNGCWDTIDKNIGKYYSDFIGDYKGKYGPGADTNRFFPTLGNHDWNAQKKCLHHGNLPYLEYFTLYGNGRYYDFVRGPVHFFALDSDDREPDGNDMKSAQYQWFVSKIKQSNSPFNVVYFHHAPYSSSSKHGSISNMQWNFAELGVDVVIAGHDHDYERIERDGIIYYVNGAGGASKQYSEGDPLKESKYFYKKKYGFMLITATDQQMVLQFINEDNHYKDDKILTARDARP